MQLSSSSSKLANYTLIKELLYNFCSIQYYSHIHERVLETLLSVQFSSVAQLYMALCNPVDCSMPGFPVHHQLLELAQTNVHLVGDAIQPSHPQTHVHRVDDAIQPSHPQTHVHRVSDASNHLILKLTSIE